MLQHYMVVEQIKVVQKHEKVHLNQILFLFDLNQLNQKQKEHNEKGKTRTMKRNHYNNIQKPNKVLLYNIALFFVLNRNFSI